MSFLTRLFGKKKKEINLQITKVGDAKSDPKDVFKMFQSTYDSSLFVKHASQIKLIHSLEGHTGGVTSIRVCNLLTGQYLQEMTGHSGEINSLALTPDGMYAISGSSDDTIRVWELETGHCLEKIEAHSGGICALSLTSDCRYAVAGGGDGTLRLWKFY